MAVVVRHQPADNVSGKLEVWCGASSGFSAVQHRVAVSCVLHRSIWCDICCSIHLKAAKGLQTHVQQQDLMERVAASKRRINGLVVDSEDDRIRKKLASV